MKNKQNIFLCLSLAVIFVFVSCVGSDTTATGTYGWMPGETKGFFQFADVKPQKTTATLSTKYENKDINQNFDVTFQNANFPGFVYIQEEERSPNRAPWYDLIELGYVVKEMDGAAFRVKVVCDNPTYSNFELFQVGNNKTIKVSKETQIIRPGTTFEKEKVVNLKFSANGEEKTIPTSLHVVKNPNVPNETGTLLPDKEYPNRTPNEINQEFNAKNSSNIPYSTANIKYNVNDLSKPDSNGFMYTDAIFDIPEEALNDPRIQKTSENDYATMLAKRDADKLFGDIESTYTEIGYTEDGELKEGDSSYKDHTGRIIPFSKGMNADLSGALAIPITVKYTNSTISVCVGMTLEAWKNYEVKDEEGKGTGKRDPLNKFKEDVNKIKSLKQWHNDPKLKNLANNKYIKYKTKPKAIDWDMGILGYITYDFSGKLLESKIVLSLSVSIGWDAQFFIWVVPVYITLGAKGEVAYSIIFALDPNPGFKMLDANINITFSAELGIGIKGVLSAGLCGEIGPRLHISANVRDQKKTGMAIGIDGSATVKATVMVFFKWSYKFAEFKWWWYRDPKDFDKLNTNESAPNWHVEEDKNFSLSDDSYPKEDKIACEYVEPNEQKFDAYVTNEQVILKNIPDGTNPKLFILDYEEVLIWIAPDPERNAKYNDFTLWFSYRKAGTDKAFSKPKQVMPRLKFDDKWCNIGDFTGEVTKDFWGNKYLVIAWVQYEKPLEKGDTPEKAATSTSIYTSIRQDGKGWQHAVKVSKDKGFLQFLPKLSVAPNDAMTDTLLLSWLGKPHNKALEFANDATEILYTTKLDNSWNWSIYCGRKIRMPNQTNKDDYNIRDYAFVEAIKEYNRNEICYDFAFILERHDKNDESKVGYYFNTDRVYDEDNKFGFHFLESDKAKNGPLRNMQVAKYNNKLIPFLWGNTESLRKGNDISSNAVFGIGDLYGQRPSSPISDPNIPINSNYSFITDYERNVVGIIWDISETDEKTGKTVSNCYAKSYIKDPATKKMIWTNAVPVVYHDNNNMITNPTGIRRSNGDWVITYRRISYDGKDVDSSNLLQSQSDLCTATIKNEPILNSSIMWQDMNYMQHPGEEVKFTVIVDNQGIKPANGARIVLADEAGRIISKTDTKDVIYPGKLYYLEASYPNLPGSNGVVPKQKITATVEPLGEKNSLLAKQEAQFMMGVADFSIEDIYFSGNGANRIINARLGSANGVKVPKGKAELVITENQVKVKMNGDVVQDGQPKVTKIPIDADLSELPYMIKQEYQPSNMDRQEDSPTRIEIILELRYKDGNGEQFNMTDAELEELSTGTGYTFFFNPYKNEKGIDPQVLNAKYNAQDRTINTTISLQNNWPQNLSDTVYVELINTQTKKVEQTLKIPVTVEENAVRQANLSFAPIPDGKSPNLYGVRIHGNGSVIFDNTNLFNSLIKQTSIAGNIPIEEVDLEDKIVSLFALGETDYNDLFESLIGELEIVLRPETRKQIKEKETTVEDLYGILQAESAYIVNVE